MICMFRMQTSKLLPSSCLHFVKYIRLCNRLCYFFRISTRCVRAIWQMEVVSSAFVEAFL